MLTPRDIPVLELLARYYLLNRRQVQRLCYQNDNDGRITRRRLGALCRCGLVNKQRMLVVSPTDESPAPVYVLGEGGRRFLAEHFQDDRYLLKPTRIHHPQHIFHHIAVAETHILFDEAGARQDAVRIVEWHNEHDIVNAEEPDRKKHFRLFTELTTGDKKLVCAPDFAFLLDYKGHRGVFYGEQDRGHGRFDHKRVAARKSPGYAELFRQQLFKKHFESTTLDRFVVLMIAENPQRRDALRRAFCGKEGADLWKFLSSTDMNAETLLHGNILFGCDDDDPQPIVML